MNTMFASGPSVINGLLADVDREEVRRYLGYPRHAAPTARIEQMLDYWIAVAASHASPRAVFQVFPVVGLSPRSVCLATSGGAVEFRGAIGEFLGPVDAVAIFIATAGPELERLAAERCRRGDALAGMILNAVGSERAEAVEAVVVERLVLLASPRGWGLTLPYSPGYCGMALTEQRKVFDALGGELVGVNLTADCLMKPLKSISGLIGLGPRELIQEHGSPCDRCELWNCNMRR
jgi:hypothetical protein